MTNGTICKYMKHSCRSVDVSIDLILKPYLVTLTYPKRITKFTGNIVELKYNDKFDDYGIYCSEHILSLLFYIKTKHRIIHNKNVNEP